MSTNSTSAAALWPGNAMALVNLADIEREHGPCADAALAMYERAAALPPCHERETPWHDAWVAAPRAQSVALASYMAALVSLLTATAAHRCSPLPTVLAAA